MSQKLVNKLTGRDAVIGFLEDLPEVCEGFQRFWLGPATGRFPAPMP
jgi:hypothetical protein